MTYYVYKYTREDGTPYYIGKGKGQRAYESNGKNARPPKDKSGIHIYPASSEEAALVVEFYAVSNYGKKCDGTGILQNIADGGGQPPGGKKGKTFEEIYGPERAAEVRRNMSGKSAHNKGKPSKLRGIPRSDETCKKMSDAQIGVPCPARGNGRRGKKNTEEHNQRVRAARAKQVITVETRNKQSETIKEWWRIRKIHKALHQGMVE